MKVHPRAAVTAQAAKICERTIGQLWRLVEGGLQHVPKAPCWMAAANVVRMNYTIKRALGGVLW